MNARLLSYFVCLLSVFVISACSSKGWYEGLKQRERVLCNQVPPSEYEECVRQSEGSYEDYQRQREDIQKNE